MQPEEKHRKSSIVSIMVVLCAALFVGYYVYTKESAVVDNPTDTILATTTLDIGGVTIEIPPGGKADIEGVSAASFGPVPDLNHKIVFPVSFSKEVQIVWWDNFERIKSMITKEPTSYDLWLSLGLSFNMIEDYEGARLAWEYATKLFPSRSVAFGNLGFLYGYHLKDPVNAEINFVQAIKNDSQMLYLYEQFFIFYRDILKNETKARALARDGLKATGNTVFFNQLLGTL